MSTIFPTRDIGGVSVTAVSDGYLQVDFGMLLNIQATEAGEIQRKAGVTNPNAVHINIQPRMLPGRGYVDFDVFCRCKAFQQGLKTLTK
ncbi:hypothetical protein [Burkholderia oklahomensis]|uniref:hypothetical protein n=1 Tax=Burkholderia oklahomensis TaxID=342113 RepID=UPI0005D9651E|nr:hypothetical protein [Burkholderia oklahomensis]AJX30981.1 beta-lactamase-like domain protein [Burkholderia oklahomensis C6786]SUW56390.1 Uncharacterised protein [Burkholderia oklahomensis]